MAQSIMLVYEPLDKFQDRKSYWKSYISFYENYWNSPSSPKSTWFGREYEDFKESLALHLNIEKEELEDCFFIKDENDQYFISPLNPKNMNILVTDNFIPEAWFILFEEGERNYFYTHTGFGAIDLDGIYYKTTVGSGIERLKIADKIIESTVAKSKDSEPKIHFLPSLKRIQEEINNLNSWLSGFDVNSILILNYGEICSFIHSQTLKNENTAMEIWDFLSLVDMENFDEADLKLKLITQKWAEVRRKASGEIEKSFIQ